MKKISVALLMLLLCGCEIRELEDRDFVLDFIVDKAENYICNVGVAEFSAQEGNSALTIEFLEDSGETIANALETINSNSSGQLYFGHTQLCLVSINALKSKETLTELVDLSERTTELTRRIIVLATDNPDAFKSDEQGKVYSFVNDYYSGNYKYKNRNLLMDLGRLTKQLIETGNAVLPIINKADEVVAIDECAIIKNNVFVGTLNQQQSKALIWLSDNEKAEDILNININDFVAAIKLKEKNIEKIPYEDKLVINILAEGEISGYALGKNVEDKEIKEKVEEKLETKINDTLKLLQKKYQTDCVGVGQLYKRNNYSVYLNNRENIDEFFCNLLVEVNVEVKFFRKSSIG